MTHPPATPVTLAPSPGVGAAVGRLARGVLALLLVPALYVLWYSAALPALSAGAPGPPAAHDRTVRLESTAPALRRTRTHTGEAAPPRASVQVLARATRPVPSRAVRSVIEPPAAAPPAAAPPAPSRPAPPPPGQEPNAAPPVSEPTPPPPRSVVAALPAQPPASTPPPPQPDQTAVQGPPSAAQVAALPQPAVPAAPSLPATPPVGLPATPVDTPSPGALAIPPTTG
jgi:hypothetical protein